MYEANYPEILKTCFIINGEFVFLFVDKEQMENINTNLEVN